MLRFDPFTSSPRNGESLYPFPRDWIIKRFQRGPPKTLLIGRYRAMQPSAAVFLEMEGTTGRKGVENLERTLLSFSLSHTGKASNYDDNYE